MIKFVPTKVIFLPFVVSVEIFGLLNRQIIYRSKNKNSYLHFSRMSQEFPHLWSSEEKQPGSGRWREAPGAEGRGSEAVEPAALCWVWEAV